MSDESRQHMVEQIAAYDLIAKADRLEAAIKRLQAENQLLREALKPFAEWGSQRDERRLAAHLPILAAADLMVDPRTMFNDLPTMGDCRKAAEMLKEGT